MKTLLTLMLTGLMASVLSAQSGGPSGPSGPTGPSGPSTPVGSSHKPFVEVSCLRPAGRLQIGHLSVVTVSYGESVSSLAFEITAQDGDLDPVRLTASITNAGVTGVDEVEWSSGSAPVPYILMPVNGQFDAPGGQTVVFTITAFDGYWTNSYSFTINQLPAPPNHPPVISLQESRAGTPRAVAPGSTLIVPYGVQLADFAFQLHVDDADSDDVVLSALVTGGGGIAVAEWECSAQPAPFTLAPVAGVFEDVHGAVYQMTLIADDGTAQTTFVFHIHQQPSLIPAESRGGAGCASGGASAALAVLCLFGVVVLFLRRRTA